MAIYCSKCGRQNPDDAGFCMGCGQSLKPGAHSPQAIPRRWEYKDITVQFPKDGFTNIQSDVPKRYDKVVPLANQIILSRIQQEGHDGWQAEGPTDFRTLDNLGLVKKRERFSFALTLTATRTTYESATIRLKRLSL